MATAALLTFAAIGALVSLALVVFTIHGIIAEAKEVSPAQLAAARVRKLATDLEPRTDLEWVRLHGKDYLRLSSPDHASSVSFPWAAVLVTVRDYKAGRLLLDNTLQEGWDGEIRRGRNTVAVKGELQSMGIVQVKVDDGWREAVAKNVSAWLDAEG